MRYTSYRYLWPPRPETKVAPNDLRLPERMGWWGQAKLNGTNTTIYVPPTVQPAGRIADTFAMGRHGPGNRIGWQPGERWAAFETAALSEPHGWYAFVGELLHSKGVGVKDTIALFDLLVDDGEYLVGETYEQRYKRLTAICARFPASPWIEPTHRVIAPGVWLLVNHGHSFREWFAAESPKMVEGLVFKNPAGRLLPCNTETANQGWQAKCRRPTDHLSF